MKLHNFVSFSLLGLLFLTVVGCGSAQKTPVDVTNDMSEAQKQMEAGNLDAAYQTYSAIVAKDPSNAEANLFTSLLTLLDVVKDQNTRDLASKFGVNNLPTSLNSILTTSPSTAAISRANVTSLNHSKGIILASEIQYYVKNTLIPRLDKSLSNLSVVEQDADFKYIVTKAVSGSDSDLELDLGEVYALDCFVSILKGILHEAISYNWDHSSSGNPFEDSSTPDFGKLLSDGASNMGKARDVYIRAVDSCIAGINLIDSETDDQSDDAIPKFESVVQRDSALNVLKSLKNSLEIGDTTFQITLAKSVIINLKTYYTSPISDWKKFYVKDLNGDSKITESDFSAGYDFTLNGLFPQLKSASDWIALVN